MTELFPSPLQVDILTQDTCKRHGLVLPEDLNAGVYKLRDGVNWSRGKARNTYILSAEEIDSTLWYHGIPLLEVRLTGFDGPHVLVGRMDVSEVLWSRDLKPRENGMYMLSYADGTKEHLKVYHPGDPIRPGLLRVWEKKRGWHAWARHLAMLVAQHRPAWDAYLAWKAARGRAQDKAIEDAEEAALRAEIEADAEAGHFTGL